VERELKLREEADGAIRSRIHSAGRSISQCIHVPSRIAKTRYAIMNTA